MTSYLNRGAGPMQGVLPSEIIHDWGFFTYERLFWIYGNDQRARGLTPQALADQAAWRNLGRRAAA